MTALWRKGSIAHHVETVDFKRFQTFFSLSVFIALVISSCFSQRLKIIHDSLTMPDESRFHQSGNHFQRTTELKLVLQYIPGLFLAQRLQLTIGNKGAPLHLVLCDKQIG